MSLCSGTSPVSRWALILNTFVLIKTPSSRRLVRRQASGRSLSLAYLYCFASAHCLELLTFASFLLLL